MIDPARPFARSNVEVARAFFTAQYADDFDRAFGENVGPDFVWVTGSAANPELQAAIPWAATAYAGRAGYMQLTGALFSEFKVIRFDEKRYSEAENRVFVEGHFIFRHKRTAKIADSDFVARFDMHDGKVIGGQFFENTDAVAAARQKNAS